nr:GTP 3',8-cyclase MoaA [Staphylothermus hellenicus]
MLIDRFGRPITHMRISVTLRCNHSCIFCHREGIFGLKSRELSPGDWGFVARMGVRNDIIYYKLTGGEPLIRDDIVDIVHEIRSVGGVVSITTNGSRLAEFAEKLAEEKVDHINVSLHSLKPDVFKTITGGDLERVLAGIFKALEYGLKLKIDYVILSLNINEYKDLISFAQKHGLDMNIIELIPLGMSPETYGKLHAGLNNIINYLEKISVKKYKKEFQSRPTYVLPNNSKITIVKGWQNPELCMKCTRIRMTPDGRIKLCIFRNDLVLDARKAILDRDEEAFQKLLEKAALLREPYFKPENLAKSSRSNNS